MFFETIVSGDKCVLKNACDEIATTGTSEYYQRDVGFLPCTGLTAASADNNEYHEVGFNEA